MMAAVDFINRLHQLNITAVHIKLRARSLNWIRCHTTKKKEVFMEGDLFYHIINPMINDQEA